MSAIGQWAARFKGDRQVTTWHKVESEIATRLVTNCGRQLERETKRGNLFTSTFASGKACEQCQP